MAQQMAAADVQIIKQLQHILCHYGIVEIARMGRAAMITKIHSDDSEMLSELLTVPAPIRQTAEQTMQHQ